jgi:UDPglucose--hexose-1-phosphate uridylyltransferase
MSEQPNASPTPATWEQRWHPLREEWVLFTAHRGGRPWNGELKRPDTGAAPSYDPTCALCPGNARLGGTNPAYTGVHWFTNDLPCFGPEAPQWGDDDDLYLRRPATGTAEVVCYHPDHGRTLAELTAAEVRAVVDLWTERTGVLAAHPEVAQVLIFENKGSAVGTSNPHPHCQIYAGGLVYGHLAREVESGRRHHARTGGFLGQAILDRELAGPRLIASNADFVACVPWFARYAYEVFVLPRRQVSSLTDLSAAERQGLADMLREVAIRYDNLWRMPMPYVMAVHQAPCDGGDHHTFPFHVEFHPPLRTPDTLKYLAGPEVGGGSMTNESNPDEKAAELRAAAGPHHAAARGDAP